MVQERRGALQDRPSPLKPIRAVTTSVDEKAEQEKRERIQRYKEERRKQMAVRYGTKESSSSDEERNGTLASGNNHKRRRRPRMGLGSSTPDLSSAIDPLKRLHGSETSQVPRNEGIEETLENINTKVHASSTRSSVAIHSITNNNEEMVVTNDDAQFACARDPSSDHSANRGQPQEVRGDSADSTTLSGSEGRGRRRWANGEERDKSHKRKSHLNRASTSEGAAYPPCPLTHLSDSSEEVPRRRRRRTPQATSGDSPPYGGGNSSPPSNPASDAVVASRLTPPSPPTSVVASDLPGYSLPPTSAVRSSRGEPTIQQDSGGGGGEKVPLQKGSAPLRKPDIPDILRGGSSTRDESTEGGSGPMTPSPGVVSATPQTMNSRPSSVVIEKPPAKPENSGVASCNRNMGSLRPSSSFKKSEGGTSSRFSSSDKREDEGNEEGEKRERSSPLLRNEVSASEHLDDLKSQALSLKARADVLSGESVLRECEQYLKENEEEESPSRGEEKKKGTTPTHSSRDPEEVALQPLLPIAADRGILSDSGQKNWGGGSEGSCDKVFRRLAFEEKVRVEERPSSPALPSGPPFGALADNDNSGAILRRNSVPCRRDDEEKFSSSAAGILKKASFDLQHLEGGDPRPILKKKSSGDDGDVALTDPKKSILKKKSLTDDELDWDRPRSILKGARSREDLMDRNDGVGSPPTPILKRGSLKDHYVESEGLVTGGGELRPILKRRETTDGVRNLFFKSPEFSEPNEVPLIRRDSAPLPCSATPSHGILKKRPNSPSLELLNSSERPLSVAERVAGMEALQSPQNQQQQVDAAVGAKPKIRSRPSSGERPVSPGGAFEREIRRSSWVPPTSHVSNMEEGGRPHPEAINPLFGSASSSRVSQKAAFFAKLEQEKSTPPLNPSMKRDRSTRFSTQPITEGEVSKASQLLDSPSESCIDTEGLAAASVVARVAMWSKRLEEAEEGAHWSTFRKSGDSNASKRKRARFRTQPVTMAEVASASARNNADHSAKSNHENGVEGVCLRKQSSESLAASMSRRLSAQELHYDDSHNTQEVVKGILKAEPSSREKPKDSPRSILKVDSRKSSFSEGEHPRGILKSDSPLSSAKGSPEHDYSRSLKSVLKKDSSSEDSKEIKSILKPESQSLEPEISSDSSSELTAQDINSSYSGADTIVQTVNHCLVESFSPPCPPASPPPRQQVSPPPSNAPEVTEYVSRKSSSSINQQVMQEAVKQALPMKTKDNLAEALRQIEPIRDKSREREKSRERVDGERVKESKTITKEEIISNIREKSLKKNEEEDEEVKGKKKKIPDGDIDEIKASFEENMRALSGLGHEERVTYRHKTRQQKTVAHKDRWTVNDFSSCRGKMDSGSMNSGPSVSSNSSSSSPPAAEGGSATKKGTTSVVSITTEDHTINSEGVATVSVTGVSSINARLISLQKNGEEGWKSRVQKDEELLSPKLSRSKARPTSLMERVTQLESSSQQWRDRVSQSDATKFTVAHKMASSSSVPSLISSEDTKTSTLVPQTSPEGGGRLMSPASERKKRSPQPKVFKSKTGSSIPEILQGSSAAVRKDVRETRKEYARSISIPSEGSKEEAVETSTVAIPRPDDEDFDSFFASSSVTSTQESNESVHCDSSDFDLISSNTSKLVVKRREIRVARKNQATKNPLRSLAQREDLKEEYTQVILGVGDRELRRMKVEELSKSSSLAMEALAGLASKENFSAVALKKVEENPVVRDLAPYSDLMLIQIKGRRHPQVRLVNPSVESVNQGDDFLLVTPHELFHYKGKFSNVIERAVASEMALYILQTKDMGVTSVLKVTDIEEDSTSIKKERFWKKLGGDQDSRGLPPGPPDADDHIEAALIASNKVFEVDTNTLVPLEEAWGQSPKYDLLSSEKVLVFDFGSEVYLWAGKRASVEKKKRGTVLVKEMWRENFDYTECDINPVFPPVIPGSETPMKGTRPCWGICGKITENVETILFKEKFLDWPDTAQQSRIKEVTNDLDQKAEPVCDLEPCNPKEMIETRPEEPDLVLEMCHLGRGVMYYDEEERRMHNISTNDFRVWHISENEKRELEGSSTYQFFSGETYVVRWYYHVTATGRTLKGTPSRHNVTGRSRVAYFFWQGRNSSISDKGVSALMTVELDEERGPHIRVTMGAEPPAFLNLFKGGFVVHDGKREERERKRARLFIVRGELPTEAHLVEFDLTPAHLRSRGCIIVTDLEKGKVYLWIGSKVTSEFKEVGKTAAAHLMKHPAEEIGWLGTSSESLELKEERETEESKEFREIFQEPSQLSRHYFCVSKDVCTNYDWTTRIWKLEAQVDHFQSQELVSSYRCIEKVSAFPVWQEELYNAPQPAVFLIDAGVKIYIWQGWFPEGGQEDENASFTGSAALRFTFARKAALQTAVSYSRKKEELIKNGSFKNGSLNISDCSSILAPKLVVAGMESLEFTNLFPIWKHHEDVAQTQEKEGRWKQGEEYCAIEVLDHLCRDRYTLEELQMVPLPDGVDPSRLEKYLSDQEFELTLGVSKREFMSLPSWKQLQLKKKGNLF